MHGRRGRERGVGWGGGRRGKSNMEAGMNMSGVVWGFKSHGSEVYPFPMLLLLHLHLPPRIHNTDRLGDEGGWLAVEGGNGGGAMWRVEGGTGIIISWTESRCH